MNEKSPSGRRYDREFKQNAVALAAAIEPIFIEHWRSYCRNDPASASRLGS